MAVPAVGSPRDDHVRPCGRQPAADVADRVTRRHARDAAVRVPKARRRRKAHPPPGLGELRLAHLAEALARDRGGRIAGVGAGLAAGEREAVTLHARVGVFQESAAMSEGLVVRMGQDRREPERSLGPRPDTTIRAVSGTRVVVVEDDPSVAELVTLYLKNAGFVVEHCATAAEARAAFARGAPACVVLDLGLPDADGLDLFAELRRRHDSPVVALTARPEALQKTPAPDPVLTHSPPHP